MALTRIENNQISNAISGNTELGINGNLKIQEQSITGSRLANSLVYGSDLSVTGNVTGGNLLTGGSISSASTITGGNIATAGYVSATSNITGGNIFTAGQVSATGNVTGNYILGNITFANGYNSNSIFNGTSNVLIATANGNIAMSVDGTPNVVVVTSTTLQANNLSTDGNALIGGNLIVNGNLVYVNVSDLNVEDPIIGLGRGPNNAPLTTDDGKDRGEQLWYYSGSEKSAFTGYDNSAGKIISATDVTITNEIVSVNNYGGFVTGNIESSTLTATGTVTAGNLATGGTVSATGTATVGNVATGGTVSATGDITGGNVNTAGTVSATGTGTFGNVATGGTVSATGNVTGGNVNTAGSVSATGTITSNGTGTFGNVATGGTVSATGTGTFGNLATGGTVSATGTVTGGNLATGGTVSATGTGTFGNVSTAGTVTATGTITGGNVVTGGTISATGTIDSANTITGGNLATGGTVSASGTVTGGNLVTGGTVSATGTATVGNVSTAGTITATGNITGGNILFGSGIVSGTGNIYAGEIFANITGNIDAAGSNTEVQFNNNGLLGASTGFTFNTASNTLAVGGQITSTGTGNLSTGGGQIYLNGTGNNRIDFSTAGTGAPEYTTRSAGAKVVLYPAISGSATDYALGVEAGTLWSGIPGNDGGQFFKWYGGNVPVASLSGTGIFSATGNITGGNLLTGGLISAASTITATNTISGRNILTGGQVSATGTGTFGNVATAGTVSATGTVQGGNVITAGDVSATGSLTGGNIYTGGVVSAVSTITGGNIATGGTVTATGTVTGGNIATGGTVSATGTVTGGNIATAGSVSATANVTGGNVNTAGLVSGGNIATGGTVSATGTVTGGNIATGGTVSATGNITGNYFFGNGSQLTGIDTNLIKNGSSNVRILTANGNISMDVNGTSNVVVVTSTGIDISGTASASGNVTGGNILTAGAVSATGNVSGGNVNTTTIYSSSDLNLYATGNINADNTYINNVLDPVQAQDAATKQYVDDAVSSGIHIHAPVYVETPVALPTSTYANGGNTFTVNQTIAGNTVVFTTAANLQPNDQLWFSSSFEGIVANTSYFVVSTPNTSAAVLSVNYNGAPVTNITSNTGLSQGVRVNSGIGATLTATANGTLTIDGVTVSNSQRVLVYQQANAVQNGVYVVSQAGNVSAPWILTRSDDTNTYEPDTSTGLDQGSYFYVQAGDTGAGESYVKTAPAGPFIFGVANITFTQFSASQVYSANTAAGLSLTGTVFSAKVDNNTTAFDGGGNIIVKASANLTTPNIGAATGTSLSATGNITGGNILFGSGVVSGTGNIYGGNISSTDGFFGNIDLTGDITVNSLSSNTFVSATGTGTFGNLVTGGTVSATGTVTGGNIVTAGLISATGTITSADTITGGNLATGGTVSATSTITGGNIATGGTVSATGNVTGGNVLTTGAVSATGTGTFGNIATAGTVSATGTVQGGNVLTAGDVSAGGSLTGGNVYTGGVVSAVSTITGGNLATGGTVSATGNVIGGNVTTAGAVSATGDVTGGNIITSGLITATGNISSAANVSGGNLLTGGAVSATGNVTGGNVNTSGLVSGGNISTAGTVSATGNITGGNILFGSGIVSGTGDIYAGNIFANITGNVDAAGSNTEIQFNNNGILGASAGFTFNSTGNVLTANGNINGANVFTGGSVSATGTVTGGNILTGGIVSATGNITGNYFFGNGSQLTGIDTTLISNGNSNVQVYANSNVAVTVAGTANVAVFTTSGISVTGNVQSTQYTLGANAVFGTSLTPTTGATVAINSTDSVLIPVGNTVQRPSGVTGMMRFNTTTDKLEIYDSNSWEEVGATTFTVIADQQFSGDGSTVSFTLSSTQTTNSCIVSINGVVQIPGTAYSVSGTTLTFTEAPQPGDDIDVRQLTTTTTVIALQNSPGNASITVTDTSNVITVTGQLQGAGNALTIIGDLSITGNATITGNVATSQINNGNSRVQIPTVNGNVNVDVGTTDNMAVFTTNTLFITGNISATGDITGQNVNSLSDATLKANVQPIANPGAVVDALQGVGYDWVNGSGHAYGMIAQKVEEVIPEAVKTDENGIKSVNYNMVIPFLVETVKELRQDIAEIKAQLKK